MEIKEAFKNVNWEKFGVYLAVASAFVIIVVYIADIKERTRALEVQFGNELRLKAIEEKLK
jgi:hypothetical protein